MSLIDDWSVRIAQAVAPQETVLAPTWARAYIEGGKAREQLYTRSSSTVGAFGAGEVSAIMPVVFHVLSVVAPALIAILMSEKTGLLLDNVKKARELIQSTKKPATPQQGKPQQPGQPQQPQQSQGSAEEPVPAPAALPPGDAYAPLRRLVEVMSEQLRQAGMDDSSRKLITYEVLEVLLSEPQGGTRYVQKLSASAST